MNLLNSKLSFRKLRNELLRWLWKNEMRKRKIFSSKKKKAFQRWVHKKNFSFSLNFMVFQKSDQFKFTFLFCCFIANEFSSFFLFSPTFHCHGPRCCSSQLKYHNYVIRSLFFIIHFIHKSKVKLLGKRWRWDCVIKWWKERKYIFLILWVVDEFCCMRKNAIKRLCRCQGKVNYFFCCWTKVIILCFLWASYTSNVEVRAI